jgi:hypothetical protein
MTRHAHVRFLVSLGLCIGLFVPAALTAWEVDTHRALSENALSGSQVNEALSDSLGVGQGRDSLLRDGSTTMTITRWLGEGSAREDDSYYLNSQYNPYGRFLNHFHHPLRKWDAAGLNDIATGQSSVLWAQADPQNHRGTGNWSWEEVRRQFGLALTSAKKADRDAALARTFRGLGQQLHLLQDTASVPHARNEAHSTGDNIEKWTVQLFQRTRPQNFAQLLAQTPRIAPRPELLTNPANSLAPVPISRFIDADAYTGESADFTGTLEDGTDTLGNRVRMAPVGLAEYTNANFVSRDTILTLDTLASTHKWWSPYPRRSSTDLNLLQQGGKLPEDILAEDQQLDTQLYISKTRDGEAIPHFLKPSYSATVLNEQGLPLSTLKFQLDDTIHEEYARRLLPRAVGYSSALLDYFFRGKLDVDLLGPDSLGNYQLTCTNQSIERLAGGTLTLYADVYNDPSAPDPQTPVRKPIPGATSLTVGTVDPGKPLLDSPVTFPAPDTDRYVAVYTGGLGQEQAQGDSPGAVIGKVLGGVRVEEVFADANGRWSLRTPTGVFPLSQQTGGSPEAPVLQSLTTTTFEWLWWGDAENLLVGLTKYPENPPIRVVAFEVPRQANSVEPRTVETPDGPVLPVTVKLSGEFPFDLPLGTQVTLDQKVHYRQPLVKVTQFLDYLWQPESVDANGKVIPGYYYYDHDEYTLPQIDRPVDDTMAFGRTVNLTLDFPHGPWGPDDNTSPYYWVLEDIGVDPTGTRLLALVWAMPDTWDYTPQSRPHYGLSATGSLLQDGTVSFAPQGDGVWQEVWIWALIDVTNRRVLATTAPEQVTHSTESRQDGTPGPVPSIPGCWDGIGYWQQPVNRYIGGPNPHDEPQAWASLPMAVRQCHSDLDRFPVTATVTEVLIRQGTSQAHLTWLRKSLADAFSDPAQLDFTTETRRGGSTDYLYWCGRGYCTLRLTRELGNVLRYPVELDDVRRARPAATAGERLVVLPTPSTSGEYVPLLVLTPGATPEDLQVAVRFQFPSREWRLDNYLNGPLVDATGDGVLLTGEYYDYQNGMHLLNGYVVALDGSTAPITVSGVDFRSSYALLSPRFVYNTEAQRFFRVTPPLGLTALPRRLWSLEGNPGGDYHVVRLP